MFKTFSENMPCLWFNVKEERKSSCSTTSNLRNQMWRCYFLDMEAWVLATKYSMSTSNHRWLPHRILANFFGCKAFSSCSMLTCNFNNVNLLNLSSSDVLLSFWRKILSSILQYVSLLYAKSEMLLIIATPMWIKYHCNIMKENHSLWIMMRIRSGVPFSVLQMAVNSDG